MVVCATRLQAQCPRCHQPSTRVHSHYNRKVADLPWPGLAVRLDLRTRRFRCKNSSCTKRVFCERLPRVVASYGRKTVRMEEALRLIGLLPGGEAGARASLTLAMKTRGKAEPTPAMENLAQLLSGVITDPLTPAELRQHIRYGISEVFNDLDDNDRVTDSHEYIAFLLAVCEAQNGGGR